MKMRPRRKAFTLIELLCSLVILAILASLLLGPASRALERARRLEWETNSPVLQARFEEQMRRAFGPTSRYPARSVDELHRLGIIDRSVRDFLRHKKVRFLPFSSETPETEPILLIEIGPNQAAMVLKGDIQTKDQ